MHKCITDLGRCAAHINDLERCAEDINDLGRYQNRNLCLKL
jgi:hypothetical protein